MTPIVFLIGIGFGALFTWCGVVLARDFRRRRPEPIDWDERTYAPPVVTTITHQSINRIREINI